MPGRRVSRGVKLRPYVLHEARTLMYPDNGVIYWLLLALTIVAVVSLAFSGLLN